MLLLVVRFLFYDLQLCDSCPTRRLPPSSIYYSFIPSSFITILLLIHPIR
ncbi:hypothetical protein M758_6G208400 [Ceratodon purpureus]|uniref:Uncharacterized protein n=1 Tax=Ceratodon purpureus TaxID=3225 RepID=A0A8T0HK59_CERPU|nr:hypothetical protein KC19_6G217600 [Ceratodon purpureus]KAG0614846.1 hypothetical protein M758_6G208400 [Ceratodon purpureus]